jgi:predicted GTPase
LRRGHLIVINKVNAADPAAVTAVTIAAQAANPSALLVRTASELSVPEAARIKGRNVLVIEDGPTITHGSMPSGAGLAAAIRFGAASVVDPRPWARGSLKEVFNNYPHIGPVLPALGYSATQIADLRETIAAVPCDLVIAATPIDLGRLIESARPIIRVSYDIVEEEGEPLKTAFLEFLDKLSPP